MLQQKLHFHPSSTQDEEVDLTDILSDELRFLCAVEPAGEPVALVESVPEKPGSGLHVVPSAPLLQDK